MTDSTLPGARGRSRLFWILAVALALVPPGLVILDRWFGMEMGGASLRALWCRSPFLCTSPWRPYFLIMVTAMILTAAFVRFSGARAVAIDPTSPHRHSGSRSRALPHRLGILVIALAALAASSATAIHLVNGTGPGLEYPILGVFFLGGWLLQVSSAVDLRRWLRIHAASLLSGSLGLAGVSYLLFGLIGQHEVKPAAIALVGLSALIAYVLRTQPSAGYCWMLLSLAIFSIGLNDWRFSFVGDEYAFWNYAHGIAFNTPLVQVLGSLTQGAVVYAQEPYLMSALQALSMRAFDGLNFGWRFAGIAASACAVWFFHRFFRTFLAGWVAGAAAFLLAVSHYLISFSRIGYDNTFALLAMGASLAAASQALRRDEPYQFMLAGAGVAFCFYVFPAALYVPPLILLLLLIYRPPWAPGAWTRWLIFLGTWLFFILPLLLQPSYWSSKLIGTFLTGSEPTLGTTAPLQHILVQLGYSFFSFLQLVRPSHFVSVSAMDGISAALVILGMGALLARLRFERFAAFVAAGFLLLLLLVGASHQYDAPPNTRLFLLVPWFALIAAVGLQWLAEKLAVGAWRPLWQRVLLGSVLALVLGLNLYQSFEVSLRDEYRTRTFEAHVVGLAANLAGQGRPAPRAILLVHDPSQHDVSMLRTILQIEYLPIELREMDATGPSAITLPLLTRTDQVVAVSHRLPEPVRQRYGAILRSHGSLSCVVQTSLKEPLFDVWAPREVLDPCGAPASAAPPAVTASAAVILSSLLILVAPAFWCKRGVTSSALLPRVQSAWRSLQSIAHGAFGSHKSGASSALKRARTIRNPAPQLHKKERLVASFAGKRTPSRLDRKRVAARPAKPSRAEDRGAPVSRRLRLAVVGAGMAFVGQSFLIGPPFPEPQLALRQWIAGALLTEGALVFGFATHRQPDVPASPEADGLLRASAGTSGFVMSRGVAAAVLISTAAVVLYALHGESGIVRLGWGAGMLALLASQLWRERPAVRLPLRKDGSYLLLLVLILAISAIVSSYRLDVLPLNFDGDFGTWGLEARALLTGAQENIFGLAWGGEPIISTLATALALWVVGDSIVGVNAAGILGGLLSILGTYLVARELFHSRVAVMAAALLGASYAYMAASRQAHFIDPVPLLTFTIYFLVRGIQGNRAWAIVFSGLLAGLCFQMYFSGRTVLLIFAFLVIYLLLFHRTLLLNRLGLLGLWLLAALVAVGPMIVVFARDYEGFMARTRVVFILSPPLVKHMMGVYQVDTLWEMLLQQARHTAFMFYYYGDTGTQFGIKRAFLDAITAPLYTLGLAYALVHWRRLSSALLIGWVGVVVVAGGFLTGGPPNWPRLFVVLPAAAILAALALDLMYRLVDPPQRQLNQTAKMVAPVVLLLLTAWIGIRNWSTYVEAKGSTASTRTRIARHMLAQPAGTVGYLVSEHYRIHDREFEFLIPGRLLGDLTPEQVRNGVVPEASPTSLILTQDQRTLVTELPDLYPGGVLLPQFGDRVDQVEFYVFQLPHR